MTQVSPAGPDVRVVSASITIGLARAARQPTGRRLRHTGCRTTSRLITIEGCAVPQDIWCLHACARSCATGLAQAQQTARCSVRLARALSD